VDGSVLVGAAGEWDEEKQGYKGMLYLPCTAENNYFPSTEALAALPQNCVIYFCSPNNPTGAVATKEQLGLLVKTALQKGCLIVFDAAYSGYIRDKNLPTTIYEIDGAENCAIEVNSFSKPAGFTGVRLGWSIVPLALKYGGSASGEGATLNADWNRICTTIFNGASNIAQYGALAALEPEGLAEMKILCDYYLENARLIRSALKELNIACVGGSASEAVRASSAGINSPYIWAQFPGRDSWDVFTEILDKCHVLTTPGSGFGPAGQSFIRFSAFGHRYDIEEACRRLTKLS
jgi:LL-diaminopimelate aminotransferase